MRRVYCFQHTDGVKTIAKTMVTNYDVNKFSNNRSFSNNTAEHFNSKTNKFDYAVLSKSYQMFKSKSKSNQIYIK